MKIRIKKASNDQSLAPLEAVQKLVSILQPLAPEDRKRALSAALILIGDSPSGVDVKKLPERSDFEADGAGLSPKAVAWLQKNSVKREQLDHVFFVGEDSIDVITHALPGKGKRQQTIQCYVLSGLRSFLGSGDSAFSDKDARDLCAKLGCYDQANHAGAMKELGNWVTGSKNTGWRLTNPGLNEALRLLRQLTESQENEQ